MREGFYGCCEGCIHWCNMRVIFEFEWVMAKVYEPSVYDLWLHGVVVCKIILICKCGSVSGVVFGGVIMWWEVYGVIKYGVL